jgi:hypothetical protein
MAGAPKFLSIIDAFQQGQQMREHRNKLAELSQIGQIAASGNYLDAAGRAYGNGYIEQGNALARLGRPDLGEGGGYGLNPVWAQDASGNWQLFQPNKSGGNPARVNFPEGVKPQPQVNLLDTGTGYVPRATKGGQPVGQAIPKDVAGEAGQKETGKGMAERNLAQPQAKLTLSSTLSALDRLGNSARQIKEDPALGKITGWMSLVPNAPGGPAANVQARLATLKSQVGFAVLQAMRDASKTGGALGNVSNFENEQLQNNLAALEQAQSVEQFQAALGQIVDYVDGAKGRLQAAYDQTYPTQQQGAPPADNMMSNDPQVGQVVNGYKIGATARNPQTGETIVWDGNGWRPQ